MKKYIINEEIKYKKFMLIDYDKKNLGETTFHDAMVLAKKVDLDLVLINESPVVVKMIDFNKFKFEESKKKKQHLQPTKEIQFSLKIAQHDFDIKLQRAIKFLEKGMVVNFKVILKGRENAHPELGKGLLEKIIPAVHHLSHLEGGIEAKGSFVTLLVKPIKG